jgi:hypothetical protein
MTLRLNELASLLIANELTEKDKIKYYLAAIYLQLAATGVPAYFWGIKLDNIGIVSYAIGAIVATTCLLTINNVNETIDGKNIIERLAVLSFPAFLQSIVLYWVIYFGVTIIYITTKIEIFLFIFLLIGLSFYFWFGFELIRKALKKNSV